MYILEDIEFYSRRDALHCYISIFYSNNFHPLGFAVHRLETQIPIPAPITNESRLLSRALIQTFPDQVFSFSAFPVDLMANFHCFGVEMLSGSALMKTPLSSSIQSMVWLTGVFGGEATGVFHDMDGWLELMGETRVDDRRETSFWASLSIRR